MVLESDVDAELALLRRLRARRSEKENAYESPAAKLRSSSATTATTRSSGSSTATRSPRTATTSPLVPTSANRLAARASAEKERFMLPPSVNTQRAAPPSSSIPRLTAATRTSAIGLVQPIERPVRTVSSSSRRQPLQPQDEPAPKPQSHKPQQQQLTHVPERIFECVLDDDGHVTTRCFLKGKFLGKGGFARCYEMTCEETGIKYAGKIVAKSSLVKPKAKQKFTSEIKIHKALKHRHIVQFEHFFEDADNAYILLELCRNQSLSDLLRRRKKISEAEVRFYIRQLVDGLDYLHTNLVIHRDLKLGNLFLTSDMEIKIGDFGLATRLDNLYDRKRTMCGTPNYIAPEILTGQRGDGHSFEVDIWSTGVVMYTLLVGRPPFETEDVKDTYKRIRANQYGFPEDTDVSESAQSLIRSILRSEPHLRPSLKAILAHPFLRDEFVPPSLSRTALLITPPDCKRTAERPRAGEPLRSTTATHLLAPRRYPLRSRDVNARSNSSSSEQTPDEPRRSAGASGAKLEPRRDEAVASASPAVARARSPETAAGASVLTSPALKRSDERQAALQDPLEAMYATLSRLFALEETGGADAHLSEFSSATSVVAAAKRLREIRAETDAQQSLVVAPATLWVAKYVDYTSKYGMGYILSNGSAGVYFNDSTKAVAAPDDACFEYLERTSEAANATDHRARYALSSHDPALAKKVTLLKHFKSYLVDSDEVDLLAPQLASHVRSPLATAAAIAAGEPMEYVKKWVKSRHAMLFCLSNDTFQINFFDASKLLLSQRGRVATFLDKDGGVAVLATALVVLKNERPDLLKRLRYARDMLQQMLRVSARSDK